MTDHKTNQGVWVMGVLCVLCSAARAQVTGEVVGPHQSSVPSELPPAEVITMTSVSPDLAAVVAELDAADYASRQAAMDALYAGPFDELMMYRVLSDPMLSSEQRHRLLSVVVDRLESMPRGALGISMDWRSEAVRVERLIPGLPAERFLQVGDLITHIDGIRLTQRNDLIMLVQMKKPGDAIHLKVRRQIPADDGAGDDGRNEEELSIEFPLGSAALLDRGNDARIGMARSSVQTARSDRARAAERRFSPLPILIEFDDYDAQEHMRFDPIVRRSGEVSALLDDVDDVLDDYQRRGEVMLTDPAMKSHLTRMIDKMRRFAQDDLTDPFHRTRLIDSINRLTRLVHGG